MAFPLVFIKQYFADYRGRRRIQRHLKAAVPADTLAVILSNMHMHLILLASLVALILHAAVARYGVARWGNGNCCPHAAALHPDISPEIIGDCYRFRCDWPQ
ncbi:hypothetical protein [Escherichia coli]|uniref:hypothetical protein n=1 Tax=Escherichia coli TaxID=562 RepID=UPI0038901ED7